MVDYSSRDSPYRSVGQQGDEHSLGIVDTLRGLKEEIRSCKENNDRLVEDQDILTRAQEKKIIVYLVILQILSKI